MKSQYLTIGFLFITIISLGQQSTIVVDSTMTVSHNLVARDAIYLTPGFTFTAASGKSFNASINSQLQIPAYSTGDQIVDPLTRSLNTSLPIGTIPGEFNVNNLGAATYQIPIFVSPGTAGMQPGISVVYDSKLDDGLLGKGWDLTGISTIQRVPQNYYNDGRAVGVSLQNTDKFALDSNRLVLVSGTYGSDNSVYNTEIETFVQVTAHGSTGTGPSWFEVKTKDGKTIEYGNTATSKVEAYSSSTVYLWRINRITDQNGNYIDFTYFENNGESYIEKIEYTGNLVTQQAPYNTLRFSYDTRSDINSHYIMGNSKVPRSALLTSIKMETEGGELVREYQFRYVLDFYTHLNEIIEFGSDHKYLNSTAIGWGDGSTPAPISPMGEFDGPQQTSIYYLGDFDGNGITDLLITPRKTSFNSSDKWELYLGKNSYNYPYGFQSEGYLDSYFKNFQIVDVNGDGKDEIYWRARERVYYSCNPHPCEGGGQSRVTMDNIVPPPQDTCWDDCYYDQEAFRLFKYNDTTLVRGNTSYDHVFVNGDPDLIMVPGDYDGDGENDFMFLFANKNIYTFSGVYASGNQPNFGTPDDVRIMDFNGDGIKDILVRKNGTNTKIYQINPISNEWETLYDAPSPTSTDRIYLGDFNGDKKTDILRWSSNAWSLLFSNGQSFFGSATTPSLHNADPGSSLADNNYYIADFNGDGKDDILESNKSTSPSVLKVFYSKGDGNFDPENNQFTKSSIDEQYFQLCDANGDGKKDLFYYDYSSASNKAFSTCFHPNETPHLVSGIANGYNYRTLIFYQRLNCYDDGTYWPDRFYARGSGATFPAVDFKGGYIAVKDVYETSCVGEELIHSDYSYEGAWIHKQGKNFLGFAKIKYNNDPNALNIFSTFEYNPSFYFASQKTSTTRASNGKTLRSTTYTNSLIDFSNKRIFPYASQVEAFDTLNSKRITSSFTYDNYGNQINIATTFKTTGSTEVQDGVKIVANTFGSFGGYNIPNKITRSKDSTTFTNKAPYIRKVDYDYNENGNLLSEKTDPGKAKEVTKTYSSYNSFGLPGQVTISASGLTSRTTTFEYDSKSRFMTKSTNPLGHYSQKTYNAGTGATITETGIDGKTTSFDYDEFGRLIKTTTPQGHLIETSIAWVTDPTYYSIYTVTTATPGRPTLKKYFDILDREVKSESNGQFGTIYAEKVYKIGGNLEKESYPHYQSDQIKWKSYDYDYFNRVTSIHENGLTSTIFYDYNSVKTTMPGNQSKTIMKNSFGNITQVTDIDGTTNINYSYHSSGQPASISTGGITVTNTYDEYGRQDTITNPNSGRTTFIYNAFGELVSQTDANNKTFQLTYDVLGRLVTKTGPNSATTSYSYVSSGNGIEQIHSITGPNGIAQTYSYDDYGRTTQLEESIPNDQTFTTSFGYDSYGNNTTVTYPSGYSITKTFSNGYLSEISKTNGPSILNINSSNALGQPIEYSLGSSNLKTSFSYSDEIGVGLLEGKKTGNWQQYYNINSTGLNIVGRSYWDSSNPEPLTEYFKYDSFNRLKVDSIYNISDIHVNYETNGNITSKTDAGSYSYESSKVNAVTSITGNQGTIPSVAQDITYTDFGMTETVTEGDSSIQFIYGPDNQRIKSILRLNNTIIKTKYYSFNYEKEVTSTGTREISYISSPTGLVAIDIKKNNADTLYYLETDNLGSILGIIKTDGTYKEKYSYDAWGRRRNPTNWSYENIPAPSILDRGFTGHEHLDMFGLINMNGRMYDQVLGRFLGVDPIIQSPDYSQNFNGYSYGLNNPLRYIDPSGFAAATTIAKQKFAEFLTKVKEGGSLEALANQYQSSTESAITKFLNFIAGWIVDQAQTEFETGGGQGGIYGGTDFYKMIGSKIRNTKFIFNPVTVVFPNPFYQAEAIMVDGGITLAGAEGDLGIAFVLAGKDTGKWAFYSEVAGGPGSDGGLSSEITRIDYNGDLDKFSIYSLGGERDKGYGGVEITGEVASIGGAFSWSPNKEIVGCTIQVGLGGSYIPWVYGGFNRGNVTLPIKLRLK